MGSLWENIQTTYFLNKAQEQHRKCWAFVCSFNMNRVSLIPHFVSYILQAIDGIYGSGSPKFGRHLQYWISYADMELELGLRDWRSFWLFVAAMRFSFHTNLQTALDKVEGYHCCVCEAAAQDTPKATQGIVLWGAKLTAEIVCSRREGTQHTCNMQGHMQHRTKKSIPDQSHIMEEFPLYVTPVDGLI